MNFDNFYETTDYPGVGIFSNKVNSTISVYPNPARDIAVVNSNQIIDRVHVLDVVGKSVLTIENVNSKSSTIDLSNITKGIYIIVAESNGTLSSNKIIIE